LSEEAYFLKKLSKLDATFIDRYPLNNKKRRSDPIEFYGKEKSLFTFLNFLCFEVSCYISIFKEEK